MENQTRRYKKTFETREKIMAATGRLLEKYGYDAVTFRSLAEESGVSFGSIQHHYGTKDNILYVYGCREFKAYVEANYGELCKTEDGKEPSVRIRLRAYYELYADFAEKMGKKFMLISNDNGHDIFHDVCFEEKIRPLIEEGCRDKTFGSQLRSREMLEADLRILCRSIVLMWSASGEGEAFDDTLKHVLARVLNRFLRG